MDTDEYDEASPLSTTHQFFTPYSPDFDSWKTPMTVARAAMPSLAQVLGLAQVTLRDTTPTPRCACVQW